MWTRERVNEMNLTTENDHNRLFTLSINEGQLAGLMVAAQEKVGSYAVGSSAKDDLARFLTICEHQGVDPANHGLI